MLKKLFSPYGIIYSFILLTTVFFFIGASLEWGFHPEDSKVFCIIFSAFMMIVSLSLIGGHFFLDDLGCWPFAIAGAYFLYCTYWKMLYPTVVPYNGPISVTFFYWAIFILCLYMAFQHLLGLREAFFSSLVGVSSAGVSSVTTASSAALSSAGVSSAGVSFFIASSSSSSRPQSSTERIRHL